jgi:Galactose-3-O-sulfotransferase
MSAERLILYLHIPKAGGTTLNACIFNQCRAGDHYVEEEDGWLHAGIYYYPNGFLTAPGRVAPGPILRVLGRSDLRAVVGHFWFGVHQYVVRPWTYVTLLRNPLERVLSLYHHLRWLAEDYDFPADMSLEEFVTAPLYREVSNDQTRRIAGLELEGRECTRSTLEVAKDNLRRHFSVVGVTDCFDETLILLKRTFGWTRDLIYYPKNQNPTRPPADSVPQKLLDAIKERNQLDGELYQFASELLDEAMVSADSSLREEVEEFKALQRAFVGTVAQQGG